MEFNNTIEQSITIQDNVFVSLNNSSSELEDELVYVLDDIFDIMLDLKEGQEDTIKASKDETLISAGMFVGLALILSFPCLLLLVRSTSLQTLFVQFKTKTLQLIQMLNHSVRN